MAAPLPRLSLWVLQRSNLRMWLVALAANLIGAAITYGWLGGRLRAVSGDVPVFDRMRWITTDQLQAQLAQYTLAMKEAYLPFSVADYLFPLMAALFLALTLGCLMLAAPGKLAETLALGHVFWLPFAMAAFDWIENAGFLYLLQSYPEQHAWLAEVTAIAKTCKTVSLWSTNALVLLLALLAVVYKLRGRDPR